MSSRSRAKRVFLVGLAFLLLLKLGFLVAFAMRARFVMDELAILELTFSNDASEYYRAIDPIKTVLAYAAFAPAFFASDSVGTVLAARFVGLLCALVSSLFVFLIARRIASSNLAGLLSLALLVSFSNFMEQAFRIRTDTVALPFALGALLLLVRPAASSSRTIGAGALLGAAFLCTQKAIYLAFAVGLGLLVSNWSTAGFRRSAVACLRLVAGWALAAAAYCAYFGGWNAGEVWRAVLIGPSYVIQGTASFRGLGGFVLQSLQRNVVPYSLALVGAIYVVARWQGRSTAERHVMVTALAITALVFSHDQPWPYVFVWPQAFLACALTSLAARAGDRAWSLGAAHALMIFLPIGISLPRNVHYLAHDSREVIRAIREAEANLALGERYFDGIGMVVQRRIAGDFPDWCWDTPTLARLQSRVESGDNRISAAILRDQPKLWILNYRIHNAAPLVTEMMAGGYVRVSPTLALAGAEILAGEPGARMLARWAGDYQLFDGTGRATGEAFSLDGGPALSVQRIETGQHEIAAVPERRVLLPAGSHLAGYELPFTGPVPDLFAHVYDF